MTEEKKIVLEITGHPGVLKNSKQIAQIPKKGARRCPSCGKMDSFTKLIPSKPAQKALKNSIAQLYAQRKHETIRIPIMVKMEFFVAWKSDKVADLSNLLQLPEDAMVQAGIIEDDSLIMGFDGSRIIKMCGVETCRCPKREQFKSGPRKGKFKPDCGKIRQCPYEKVVITITKAKSEVFVPPWAEHEHDVSIQEVNHD